MLSNQENKVEEVKTNGEDYNTPKTPKSSKSKPKHRHHKKEKSDSNSSKDFLLCFFLPITDIVIT